MMKLEVQSNGITHDASSRRTINLNFIEKLPLENFSYKDNERALFLYKTSIGEELYLQYPGKESREETRNPNPKDFRPKIFIDGKMGKDLSFGDVWESFFDLLKKFSVEDKEFLLAIDYLIALLYKSAYLIDFQRLDTPKIYTFVVKEDELKEYEKIGYPSPVLLYDVDKHMELISFVQNKIGNLCGMSIEAFLLYNDILGWNEDSKYYQRALRKGKKWANGTGKPNTMLTHINILGYIHGEFKISKILSGFTRTRGVSAPTQRDLKKLFDEYVNPALKNIS